MHPLGLSLDFLFGRGYLSARGRALGEWATLESLRMEIPDLTFPFDAGGGVDRFRNTRCQVRHFQLTISESAFGAALGRALGELEGFEDLKIRFADGAAHGSVRFRTLGADTFITFKLGLIPPEPAVADMLHVIFYDVRTYGPLPYPARMLVSELIDRLLATPQLQRIGGDKLFKVGHHGDLIAMRPLKLCLMSLFPPHGWKMPSLAGIQFETIDVHPGAIHISARSEGQPWEARREVGLGPTASGPGAAEAMAAYEARDLCRDADAALWEGQIESSVEALHGLRELYGLHPALVSRLLDALMASSGTGHLAEARALLGELTRAEPDNLLAHLAAPTSALLRGDLSAAGEAYDLLAAQLRKRGENQDLVACLVASAIVRQRQDQAGAVALLREVTQLSPRHRLALELLRGLYIELDEPEHLVDTLKRLAGLYTERANLLGVYQSLAERLMNRGDLAEARLYLEKILRLDPARLESLSALGESYMLDGQPLRALKAFGSAARAAEQRGENTLVAQLHLKIADLWSGPLEDPAGALLACRRALSHAPKDRRALSMALQLAGQQKRYEEALDFIDALVPLVEGDVEEAIGTERAPASLAEAHRVHLQAADIDLARGRHDAAAAHHRRALTYRRNPAFEEPIDEEDLSVTFLDEYYRQMGRPEDLLDLYRAELHAPHTSLTRRARLRRALAVIFDQVMGLGSEAVEQLRASLEIEPHSDQAISMLVSIMGRDGRHFELRDALRDLEARVSDRRLRGLVLRHLGELHLVALPDPPEAARLLRQAMLLRPADDQGATILVQAERALIAADVGADLRPLLKALERVGELGGEEDARHSALMEAGDLCFDQLLNPTLAAGYYQRAMSLRRDPRAVERLKIIHERTGYNPVPLTLDIEPDDSLDALALPDPPTIDLFDPSDQTPQALSEDTPSISAFREGLIKATTKPTDLADSLGVLNKLGQSPKATDRHVRETRPVDMDLARQMVHNLLEPSQTDTLPVGPEDDLMAASIEEDDDLSNEGGLSRKVTLEDIPTRPMPILVRKAVREEAARARHMASVLEIVTQARESGDPGLLRDALETSLTDEELSPENRARFVRELGLLYYYDLEQLTAAEEYLTKACTLDPEGAGSDFDVLTALEGIYEDMGLPEKLLDVYRRKRQHARDTNMKRVYALLSAELLWERLDRPQDATSELEEVIADDPDNVPALRMLADIARRRGDTEAALGHLRQITANQPSGDFDLMDALRDMGRLLLEHIAGLGETPQADAARREAIGVFEHLLEEAPGDGATIAALKPLQEQIGDHSGALKTLGMELGLLLGTPDAFPEGPAPGLIDPQTIPAPLVIPVSQILTDVAALRLKMNDEPGAVASFGLAVEIWPENIEALSERLDLLRQHLAQDEASEDRKETAASLCNNLDNMAAMLLAPGDRFEVLFEAAEIIYEHLKDTPRAIALLNDALALVEDIDDPAPELAVQIERARETRAEMARHETRTVAISALTPPPNPLQEEPPTLTFEALARPLSTSLDEPLGSQDPSQADDFPLTTSSSTVKAKSGTALPAPPPSRPTRNNKNPFGLPPLKDPVSGDDLAPEPWSQLESSDTQLSDALQQADEAETAGERDKLIKALEEAIDACEKDPETPAPLHRQLLVRLAESLLGQRPQTAPGQAPRRVWPTTRQVEEALLRADAALAFTEVDEPEAHFARIAALRNLEEHPLALDALRMLAMNANNWSPDQGPDTDELELERRIVAETLQTLTESRAMDRRDQVLHQFATLNPRIAKVLEEENI